MDLKCTVPMYKCGHVAPCGGHIGWKATDNPAIYTPKNLGGCAIPKQLTHDGTKWRFQLKHGPSGCDSGYSWTADVDHPTGVYSLDSSQCPSGPPSGDLVLDWDD